MERKEDKKERNWVRGTEKKWNMGNHVIVIYDKKDKPQECL